MLRSHHIGNIRWFHLLEVRVVDVSPGEVEAPGCVSVVEEVTEVSASVELLLTGTKLTQGNDPRIGQDILYMHARGRRPNQR